MRRLVRARWVCLWAGVGWLAVLLVWRPEVRESVGVSLQVYWLLLAWFWLARTKTVGWRLVAGLYAVGMVWAFAIGFITYVLARQAAALDFGVLSVPGQVGDLGSLTMIAGVGEESAKLIPLAVLGLLAPARVRRFAVVDWLLLGFASGLAFQASEELARRTAAHVLRPGLFDLFDQLLGGQDARGPGSGYPQYSLSPLGGWSQWVPGTQFPGHHASTALVAAAVGLGVAGWRHAGHVDAGHRAAVLAWRSGAVLAPLVMWWLVVSVHAGGNATSSVGDKWLTSPNPSMPWLIRAGWAVAHHGVGVRWLLPVLLLLALLVDARHLRRGDAGPAGPVLPAGFGIRSPGPARSVSWTAVRAGAGAVADLAVYLRRDLTVLVAAHAPAPGEARRAALGRGRLAMGLLRQAREEGLARCLGPAPPWRRRRTRLLAGAGLLLLLLALVWLAPYWAHQVGASPTARALGRAVDPGFGELPDWFARLLDALGQWWAGLSPGEKIAVGAGVAFLVVLSGGSLGLGLGLSGATTYVLGHGRGASAFLTDPGAATRSYLSHTTPLGIVADTGEAVLTFLPGNFAGAAGGKIVRDGIDLYRADPEAFWAAAARQARDDAGAVRLDQLGTRRRNTWPETLQDMADGAAFNRSRWAHYQANEITLTNGRILDSYTPEAAIVSRKLTQLGEVQERTAIGYLKELVDKYPAGATVADTAKARAQFPGLVGTQLDGRLVLEVPVQTAPVPRAVLDFATDHAIDIRDIAGRVYP